MSFVRLDFSSNDRRKPDLLAINPKGRVPARRDRLLAVSLLPTGELVLQLKHLERDFYAQPVADLPCSQR